MSGKGVAENLSSFSVQNSGECLLVCISSFPENLSETVTVVVQINLEWNQAMKMIGFGCHMPGLHVKKKMYLVVTWHFSKATTS